MTSLLSLNEKRSTNNVYTLKGELYGEVLDPNKHKLHVDIKAITLHRFKVVQGEKGWEATVVLDI